MERFGESEGGLKAYQPYLLNLLAIYAENKEHYLSSHNPQLPHTITIPQDLMLPSARQDGKQKPHPLHVDDEVQKKLMHRDIERQRRQEMATLYASLRSLLPLEYIKGKRSISDHMNEAVKYIKHLENRTRELSDRRDKLKKLCSSDVVNVVDPEITTSSTSSSADPPTNVTVRHHCLGGLEVVLSAQLMLPLSRILDMLHKDGFTIVNCTYTRVEQRLIYNIHLEASELTSIDLCALQRKLAEAAPSSSN